MPLVSILIPNYNHAPFLQQRIDSVLNQTFQDFEVIIMDDCSTDNSRDIIQQYQNHPKVSHVLLNEVNSGSPFKQWQKGFEYTKGQYIWIAESDDYSDKQFLSTLVGFLNNHNDVGIVYSDAAKVDINGIIDLTFFRNQKNSRFSTDKWSNNYIYNSSEELSSSLIYDCTINNMSATLFRKNMINTLNWSQLLQFRYCGDWYFLIHIVLTSGSIGYIAEPLNFYRLAGDNFKSNVKSSLNYHKERIFARYYFFEQVKDMLTKSQHKILYFEIASSFQIQINDCIKGRNKLKETLNAFKSYYIINANLLYKSLFYTFKIYFKRYL